MIPAALSAILGRGARSEGKESGARSAERVGNFALRAERVEKSGGARRARGGEWDVYKS